MPPIGVGTFAHIKRRVKKPKEKRIGSGLGNFFEHPAGRVEMTVAAREQRDSQALRRERSLEIGFEVPAENEHGIRVRFRQAGGDLGRVTA